MKLYNGKSLIKSSKNVVIELNMTRMLQFILMLKKKEKRKYSRHLIRNYYKYNKINSENDELVTNKSSHWPLWHPGV